MGGSSTWICSTTTAVHSRLLRSELSTTTTADAVLHPWWISAWLATHRTTAWCTSHSSWWSTAWSSPARHNPIRQIIRPRIPSCCLSLSSTRRGLSHSVQPGLRHAVHPRLRHVGHPRLGHGVHPGLSHSRLSHPRLCRRSEGLLEALGLGMCLVCDICKAVFGWVLVVFRVEEDPEDGPPFIQQPLPRIYRRRRIGGYVSFHLEFARGAVVASFRAVVVDVYVEHLIPLPRNRRRPSPRPILLHMRR